MSLAPGAHLGSYEVIAGIGVGGMGEVYRARDTKLGRDVALKILPAAFAQDAERLARFRREAQVLASLNHPNIAQIHGLEDSSTTHALVMELVDGQTLADRIARGERDSASQVPSDGAAPSRASVPRGLGVDAALAIAKQIADALEAAHEQGIVHRDLKPANVKVREDGTVKVLDFGLAKALDPIGGAASGSVSMSPTITSPAMTQMGMILGTAAYMSPEQAKGRTVDARADVWAFGAVLFEMLSGRRAFDGEDVGDVLSAVMRIEPAWDALPADVPPRVRQVLSACLQKNPKARLASMQDVRLALDGAFETVAPPAPAPASAPSSWRRRWPAAAALLTVLAGASGVVALWPSAPPRQETRWRTFPAGPDGAQLERFAVSPDGRLVAMTASQKLWLWPLDSLEAKPLAGTEGATGHPFWSPDSRSVGFVVGQTLHRIDVDGGPVQTLARGGGVQQGHGTWSRQGVIVFRDSSGGFSRVSARGGTVVPVVRPSNKDGHLDLPVLLPDGTHFLYLDHTASSQDERGIKVASLDAAPDAQPAAPVLAADDGPLLVQDEGWDLPRVLFLRQGELLAQAFDPRALAPVGEPIALATSVRGGAGSGFLSASARGDVLLYLAGTSTEQRRVIWVDRTGGEETVKAPAALYAEARLSPDGRRLALSTSGADGDVYTWDLAREVRANVTASEALDMRAVWAPDGRRLIFASNRDGAFRLYWQSADGVGAPESLTGSGTAIQIPLCVSPDGKWLIFIEPSSPGRRGGSLRMMSLTGDHAAQDLVSADFYVVSADVSPNGRWIAYESDRSGEFEIYVSPFPNTSARLIPISSGGGSLPAWAPDGRTLFYVNAARQMVSVPTDDRPADLVPGRATTLFDTSAWVTASFEVVGDRFLAVTTAAEHSAPETRLNVVLNWFDAPGRLESGH